MAAKFLGIILRSQAYDKTAEFYQKLGLSFFEHQHGGPKHYQTENVDPKFVVEIYKKSAAYPNHSVIILVSSLQDALGAVNLSESVEIKTTEKMRFAYVHDPDGTPVMLIENI